MTRAAVTTGLAVPRRAAIRRWLAEIRAIDGRNLEGDAPSEVVEVPPDKVILRLRRREGPRLMDLHQLYVMRDGKVLRMRNL